MSKKGRSPKKAQTNAPKIQAREVSMWGDMTEEEMQNPSIDQFDLKGYSDKRREFEEAVKRGERPKPLPFRFQYTSVMRSSGAPDGRKQAARAAKGYKVVKWDEAENYGIQLEDASGDPVGAARRGDDGNVYVGSQMLMVAPREVAAREAARINQATNDQLDAVDQRLKDKAAEWNKAMHLSESGGTEFSGFSVDEDDLDDI